jgi:hypothetical protein
MKHGWSEATFDGGHRAQAAAGLASWLPKARRSRPNLECRRRRCTTGAAPYGGMDIDAAGQLKELREQNSL